MDTRTLLVTALPFAVTLSACSNTSSNMAAPEEDPLVKKAMVLSLAKTSGCFECHGIDSSAAGPAWTDVAVRYHDDRHAKAKLIDSVKYGSSDAWGELPMPGSDGKVQDNEIEQMVDFILALNNE
ncbi:MAG: c-type cytochrome [Pseudomonadota bacterium]